MTPEPEKPYKIVPEYQQLMSIVELEGGVILETNVDEMRGRFLHAGTYVHGLEERGLTHEQASRINSELRDVIYNKARELGIDVDREILG